MAPQRRPAGPAWPVTPAWQDEVRALMKERGVKPAQLAKMIGVTRASVTNLLAAKARQSRLVPAIHQALRIPLPATASVGDEALATVQRGWPDLEEKEREYIAGLVRIMTSKP